MARQGPIFTSFNRGEVSLKLQGRTDIEHLRLAAEIQENWQPLTMGPMTLRPGSECLGVVNDGNIPTSFLKFVASSTDRAIIELQPNQMRVWTVNQDDSVSLVTRAAVSTVIPPLGTGTWAITQATGTTVVQFVDGALEMDLVNIGGNGGAACSVTIASGDVGVEHAVRLVVADGPVSFLIGTAQGVDDLFATEVLNEGTYSLTFTPTVAGTIYVQINTAISPENYNTVTMTQPQGIQVTVVSSIAIEPAGPMTLPTPWGASVLTDQPNNVPGQVRYDASADVTFVACKGVPQQQINRYNATAWSIVLYKPVKGPMNATQGSTSTLLTIGNTTGNTILTSNVPLFKPSDVGTLFRLFHNGQVQTESLSVSGTVTDAIRVTGVSTISVVSGGTIVDENVPDRTFQVFIEGSWVGTVALQRSFSGYTTDFSNYKSYTGNTSEAIDDSLNNVITYYRFLFVGTGTVTLTFSYIGGGAPGVVRITNYVSSQEVDVEVLVPTSTSGLAFDWRQSEWSALQGFPTCVALHEGRLWWSGADRWWGSTSDDYSNFDFDMIGDAAYIDEQVGKGPIANINWLLSIDSLLAGGDTQIIAARSDAIQTPLTATNFNLRFSTSHGSAAIQAVNIDNIALFVNQSTRRIFQAIYDIATYNYKSTEVSDLNPDIGAPGSALNAHTGGYLGLALQRNPDNILHLIRSDGQTVCLLLDPDNQVKAFWRKTTQGAYDNVLVLPAPLEDMVITSVVRDGVRYLERFARLDETTGDDICKLADCFGVYDGDATTTLTFSWLANQTVVIWADGQDLSLVIDPATGELPGPFVMDRGGSITTQIPVQKAVVGLPYTAKYLTTKLAYGGQGGTAINEIKRVDHLGFLLLNTHSKGLRYSPYVINRKYGGGTVDNPLYDPLAPIDLMPEVEEGAILPSQWMWATYDEKRFEFPDNNGTDPRIYIEAASPRPATVIAMTFELETADD